MSENGGVRSYYGQPIVKRPVWTAEIPVYFFAGGMAGASAGLAYLAELRGNDELSRRAWAAAMGGIAVSPVLLISDLGRPRRFLNMLRMLKVTSPMSVGSWILNAAGAATTVAAASVWSDLFPRAGRAARPAAALLGLPLSTYTAALVTNTAIPVWHEAGGHMALVFGAGAAASAGAVAVAATPVGRAAPARRLALGGAAAELVATQVMQRSLGEIGEPYRQGAAGALARAATALTVAGAATIGARAGRSRVAAGVGGTLLAAGSLAERWAIYRAGFQSAADPKYVVGPQRRRIEEAAAAGG